MGSFSYTCAVSGFPIQAGDAVRFFLLNQNPYGERVCETHGLWVPRTFPIKAKYNDYGSVEDFTDEVSQAVWLKGFQKDLVEKGWGDNSCHDVPCRKEMTFSELLEALLEQRVAVARKSPLICEWDQTPEDRAERDSFFQKRFEALPTFRFVEDTLRNKGFAIYSGAFGTGGYEVNEVRHGVVRINPHKTYSDKDNSAVQDLEKVQALFPQFASMIAAGEANSHGEPDLILRPKPFTKDYHGSASWDKEEQPIAVDCAMIREDVWQALLSSKIEDYGENYKTYNPTVENYVTGITEAVNRSFEKLQEEKANLEKIDDDELQAQLRKLGNRLRSMSFDSEYRTPGAWIVAKSVIPFSIGLAEHWHLLMQMGRPSKEHIRTAAEMAYVQRVLMGIRYTWHPSNSAGPQYGGWPDQEHFMTKMLEIAKKNANKERRNRW